MTTDVSVGVRWDPLNQGNEGNEEFEFDYDGGNSSSRLFERSRIKALAGKHITYAELGKNALKPLKFRDKISPIVRVRCNKSDEDKGRRHGLIMPWPPK